jgi:hypothetical protein
VTPSTLAAHEEVSRRALAAVEKMRAQRVLSRTELEPGTPVYVSSWLGPKNLSLTGSFATSGVQMCTLFESTEVLKGVATLSQLRMKTSSLQE